LSNNRRKRQRGKEGETKGERRGARRRKKGRHIALKRQRRRIHETAVKTIKNIRKRGEIKKDRRNTDETQSQRNALWKEKERERENEGKRQRNKEGRNKSEESNGEKR
jgi:hypothetical protein